MRHRTTEPCPCRLQRKCARAKWIPLDAVLIALYGATIGKLGKTTYPVTTNQAVAYCIPNPSLITPDFLFWYLLRIRSELVALGQGGAQSNISQTILKQYPLQLPPPAEQRRIVARLDALLGRLAAARAELARVPRLAERNRQAVLAITSSFDRLSEVFGDTTPKSRSMLNGGRDTTGQSGPEAPWIGDLGGGAVSTVGVAPDSVGVRRPSRHGR